jgi:hypothetical protein
MHVDSSLHFDRPINSVPASIAAQAGGRSVSASAVCYQFFGDLERDLLIGAGDIKRSRRPQIATQFRNRWNL